MLHMYLILFDSSKIDVDELVNIIKTRNNNFCHYHTDNILTMFNGTAQDIYHMIGDIIYAHKSNVLVIEVKPETCKGIAAKWFWEWLNEKKEVMNSVPNVRNLL